MEPVQLSTPSGEAVSEGLQINKFAKVDTQKKETHFTLKIKNGNTDTKKISFVETIEKSVAATSDDIVFVDKPHKIIQRDPKFQWLFENVTSGQEKNVSYYVNKVVNDTESLLTPSIEDITVLTGQVIVQQQPQTFSFDINYTALNIFGLLALAMAGILLTYRFEHLRRRTSLNGLRRFIGKPILAAETGRKIGTVEDVTFMPATGELLNVIVRKPTQYGRRLLLVSRHNRLYVPFQAVQGIGDYIVITEKDIIFEAVLKKRSREIKVARPSAPIQTDTARFYKTSGTVKIGQAPKEKQETLVQFIGPFKFSTPSLKGHMHQLKSLYRDGVMDENTYKSAKKRLLSNNVHENIIGKIKNKAKIFR